MSLRRGNRRTEEATATTAAQLRAELETLRNGATLTFDDLTTTEQSAASLGVHPESWKPIA